MALAATLAIALAMLSVPVAASANLTDWADTPDPF
jgi:hypothetical protein